MKKFALSLSLMFSFVANADIVSIDSVFGSNTVTQDTDTGLEWLDVTVTAGMSYSSVLAEMSVGGDLDGYRYATVDELDQLIANFGYTPVNGTCPELNTYCDESIAGDSSLIENIIKMLGDTHDAYYDSIDAPYDYDSSGAGYVYGLLAGEDTMAQTAIILDSERVLRSDGSAYKDNADKVSTSYGEQSYSAAFSSMGSFLVYGEEPETITAVPVPAAGWMFISALLGLMGRKLAAT